MKKSKKQMSKQTDGSDPRKQIVIEGIVLLVSGDSMEYSTRVGTLEIDLYHNCFATVVLYWYKSFVQLFLGHG